MGLFDLFKSKTKDEKEAPQGSSGENKVSFEVLRDDGVRAMKMGEVAYAAKCFQAALEMKDDLQTLSFLAEAQIRLQNYEAARPALEKLIEAEPDNLTLYLLLARALGELKDYKTMKEIADKAIALDEKSASAKFHSAKASFEMGDAINAIVLLTQALLLQPGFAEARYLRSQVLASMFQYKEALADTTLLLKTDSENEDYVLQHVKMMAANDLKDEAIKLNLKLMEYNPFNQEAILLAAKLYQETSQYDKALDVLNEAIENQPEFAMAYKIRGGIKLHLKDELGAAEDLKKSLQIEPNIFKQIEGEFSTLENKMNNQFKNMNPYGF